MEDVLWKLTKMKSLFWQKVYSIFGQAKFMYSISSLSNEFLLGRVDAKNFQKLLFFVIPKAWLLK